MYIFYIVEQVEVPLYECCEYKEYICIALVPILYGNYFKIEKDFNKYFIGFFF